MGRCTSMIKLISEYDVEKVVEEVIVEDDKKSLRDKKGKLRYKDIICAYIDGWKKEIEESSDGKIVVRIRHIRENILREGYENSSDNAIYMRIRHILLEYGINVRLWHHYGANLIMMLVDDESMIISDTIRARMVREKFANKLGFDNFYSYWKTTDGYKNKHIPCDMDIECSYYLGYHIRDKIAELFDDVVKNPIAHRHQYISKESGLWDWKCKNGILIKHLASCHQYLIKTDKLGREYEWSGWSFHVKGNNVPDYYLLLGYGNSRENLEIVRGWLVPSKDRIRRREFWNREGFTIRTDKGPQLMEMSQYEISHDKIEKIRKIIKQFAPIIIDDMHIDIRKQIVEWYKTYFR